MRVGEQWGLWDLRADVAHADDRQIPVSEYVSLVQDASEANRGCTVRLLIPTYTFAAPMLFLRH